MKALNTKALDQARQLIKQRFGDLSDLPEDVRNTIANTYYEFCHMGTELNHEFATPQTVALADDFMKGFKEYGADAAHIMSSAEFMPEIIAGIREVRNKGNGEHYKFVLQVFLDNFKYRIPNAGQKSSLRLNIERPFYVAKVKEIENLRKLV